ncbi:NAD(P)-binding protein [Mycena rosella]|uniref:NAD(P)-binding protein n=1 Tax=Mycena rosella TaxID=1033263 RepID=A0AAD7G0I5_MYCRO|nr:NAD(P)-binding protein [Mycena rosella]
MASPVVVVAGIGNGSGTGGAVARLFAKEGYTVALVSRGAESLDVLAKSIHALGGKAEAFPILAYGPDELTAAFTAIHARYPAPEYAPFLQVTPEDVRVSTKVNIEGSFAFARAAILAFQTNKPAPKTGKKGTLVFTGVTASLRGNVITSAFVSGKFAVRALSQSLAKEFEKENIHAIIDGGIATGNDRGDRNSPPSGPVENPTPDLKLIPESIAADRSAWTWKLDLRPAHEKW